MLEYRYNITLQQLIATHILHMVSMLLSSLSIYLYLKALFSVAICIVADFIYLPVGDAVGAQIINTIMALQVS